MKKTILVLTAASAVFFAYQAFAWSVVKDHGDWVQIRCNDGTTKGVKPSKSAHGKWVITSDPFYQKFSSFESAADNACRGYGG